MKRCVNPSCESAFLFGDDKTTCPFCHSALVESAAGPGFEARTILPPDRVTLRDTPARQPGGEGFLRETRLGTVECHGRILEIDHQELFHSKQHKLLNTLLRGEPYQFAHQTIEYTIRVENVTDGFSTEVTDFCLFGSYLGRLQVGDEVVVHARNLGDRRVVKSIYNQTTSSVVKPGFQLPAAVVRGGLLLLALALTALICRLVWLVQSGAVTAAVVAIGVSLLPLILVFTGLWLMVKSIFPRRRRR